MRLESIHIRNFKCFKNRIFNFTGQFTLLIGDNGTGKTSVLEAICVGLSEYLAGLNAADRNIIPEEVRRESKILGDATLTTMMQFPVEITCTTLNRNNVIKWKRMLKNIKSDGISDFDKRPTTFTKRKYIKGEDYREITKYTEKLRRNIYNGNDQNTLLPVIVYMSAARTLLAKIEKWESPFEEKYITRFSGYKNCLDAESNIKLLERWLWKMQLIEIQRESPIGELDAVVGALRGFLHGLLDTDKEIDIYYDFRLDEVMIKIGDENLPLNLMSAGYQSIIGMVADLAHRTALLNPQLRGNAVLDTPGIVLIDEIDLHIHPKWQWKIVDVLKKTFPQIQFIATTHSPIVIASCAENEVINLYEENGEIKDKRLMNPYGWLIEDVLTDIMGADKRSPETEKLIRRVKELYMKKMHQPLTEEEKTEMQQVSNVLLKMLPEGDPAVTLAKLDALEKNLFGDD